MKKNKKLIKIILIITIGIFVIITLINQQKTLNQYDNENKELAQKIQEQKDYNKELTEKKDEVDSLEFIEETAREMLDMYYPNERIYVDNGV